MRFRKSLPWLSYILIMTFVATIIFPSAPIYAQAEGNLDILIEDVWIPMRDGVTLAAKVYRPKAEGKYPVLLTRTPYQSGAFQKNKDGSTRLGDSKSYGLTFPKYGYVVVVQDARGRFHSEGDPRPFLNAAEDGEDTLAWIAQQEWSNAKVGMFGISAKGINQTLMLESDSPYLKAMFIMAAPAQMYEETLFQGGAYRQELAQVWRAGQNIADTGKKFGRSSPEYQAVSKAWSDLPGPDGLFWYLPLREFPTLSMKYNSGASDYDLDFKHYIKDGFFDEMDITLKYKNSSLPAYHVGGWYDVFREGTIKNFVGLQEQGAMGAKGNQKLLMGPWHHQNMGNSKLIDGDEVSIKGEMKRWFDYWLKDIDNGIMNEKPVRFFTMGNNEWQQADAWPIPATTIKAYFHSGGKGTTESDSLNNGRLTWVKPKSMENPDTYSYDPKNPTVTVGGQLLFSSMNIQGKRGMPGPKDQRDAEKGNLTYTTPVLTEDVTVTGKITATVYASSDRKDTDFVVRLTDVDTDGSSDLITDGIIRARFRDGQHQEVFMEPGNVYRFEIDLGNISHTFKKGHRVRVAVASSNFPRFDRNANTGNPIGTDQEQDLLVARNTIYHNEVYPSHISLPVVN